MNTPLDERTPVYRSFEDLEVYKAMREFRKAMYRVAKRLPDFEKFSLASQIRRAAVSLTNNLAEGHGRFHFLDQIKFTLISRGSLAELIDDLNVCSDENYLPSNEVVTLKNTGWQVLKLTNGYLPISAIASWVRVLSCVKHLSLAEPPLLTTNLWNGSKNYWNSIPTCCLPPGKALITNH
jgi:four helix bundle protein